MKILFFGDGKWASDSLDRLLKAERQIVGLVLRTQPTDPDLVRRANDQGLPVFKPAAVNAPEFIATVESLGPDLNLSVSYDQILKAAIRQTAPLGFVNFHAGKLPFYRGRNILNWALINGEEEIGITAHYVDDGIDTGDIILQRTLPVAWEDTYGDLLEKVIQAFPDLVADTVKLVAAGRVDTRSQAGLPGTYFAARGEGDEWIDWQDTSRNIYNKIRAISHPGPGARTLLDDAVVKIWKAVYQPEWPVYQATPGQVVGRTAGQGVAVKTGDSVLELHSVETDTDGVMVPQWPIGTCLGLNPAAALATLSGRIARLEKKQRHQEEGDQG